MVYIQTDSKLHDIKLDVLKMKYGFPQFGYEEYVKAKRVSVPKANSRKVSTRSSVSTE